MYTVVGVERKVGVYEGREYDNTILHCTYNKDKCEGVAVCSVKVKTSRLDEVVEVGASVSFLYDQYGNCARVDVA